MAQGGRRPTATVIKLATGNPGKRAVPVGEPQAEGTPIKPTKLRGRGAVLWDELVERAPWLAAADSYKMRIWCELYAEFERSPRQFTSARHGQLRNAGSELGLDPSSRARLGQKPNAKPKGDDEKYFD